MKLPLRLFFITCILFITVSELSAKIIGSPFTYNDGATTLKGYIAYDDSIESQRPGVLIVHEWWGHDAYVRLRADMLAKLGYIALAVDMYGDGNTASHPKDAGVFAQAVMSNMPLAQSRFNSALKILKEHPKVDKNKIAAIGYCFGGGVVLNMALMGADVKGVASFHGSLPVVDPAPEGKTTVAVLVCNGADDVMVKQEQIEEFKKLSTAKAIDLTFINYPGAKHSFTNPRADEIAQKFELPLAYSPTADKESWADLQTFLKKIFGQQ